MFSGVLDHLQNARKRDESVPAKRIVNEMVGDNSGFVSRIAAFAQGTCNQLEAVLHIQDQRFPRVQLHRAHVTASRPVRAALTLAADDEQYSSRLSEFLTRIRCRREAASALQ